jgi:hypothetical protein
MEAANAKALERIRAATPVLIDLCPASEVIPALGNRDFLHAGPPLAGWHEACGALRGAIVGTLLHTGLAADLKQAEALAQEDSIRLVPAQDHNALGTYAGVITRRTPVLVVENRACGIYAFAALNEGRINKASPGRRTSLCRRLEIGELGSLLHEVADRALERLEATVAGRAQRVLHLHRLEHQERGAAR